mgnify:CR=1 FL=1
MSLPHIAIIGRANVGKSTLFNRITRTRSSIVNNTPGVTRDRIYGQAEWNDREFMVIDTGGEIFENLESNNSTIAASTTTVPPVCVSPRRVGL